LRPTRLQRAGKAAMNTPDFLRGFSLPADARFY
jgi:methionyl-tRNA formyltransferase